MERRNQLDDKMAELEMQTWNLFPERWGQLYREGSGLPASAPYVSPDNASIADRGHAFDGEPEIPVTINDIDQLNQFYENRERPHRISGADIADFEDGMPGLAFGPSRRV